MNTVQPENRRKNIFGNIKIRTKFLGVFFATILISVITLSIFTVLSVGQNLLSSTGDSMVQIANAIGISAPQVIQESARNLEVLALSPDIIASAKLGNQAYLDFSEEQITEMDQQWQDGDQAIESTIQQIEQNALSERLRAYMQNFPENVEVFATGTRGLNIAMTGRTGDFLQAGEGWWDTTLFSGSTFIDDVELDTSTNTYAINIATPIRDGKIIVGILRSTVDVSVAFDILSDVRIGETGSATLIDRNGIILYTKNPALRMQQAPDWLLNYTVEEGGWSQDYTDLDENPAVLAYHKLSGQNAEKLGWTVILNQNLAEINQVVTQVLINNAIIAIVLLLVLGAVGLWLANDITHPLILMAKNAAQLAKGEISQNVNNSAKQKIIMRGDELGLLGKSVSDTEAYLSEMAEKAQQISQGDLTATIKPASVHDSLGNAFVKMVSNLREQVSQLTRSAENLNLASSELANA
ncbi:MAG: hypothetical protein CVU39_23090, partial [Chloroflexi bacterium HGW-Chloroflexi-10]